MGTTAVALSPFGIEPGVCLKNVAAIITQQQHQQHQITTSTSSPSTQSVVAAVAAVNGAKELLQEVIVATTTATSAKETPDFHFDKQSQFTGMYTQQWGRMAKDFAKGRTKEEKH